MSFSAALLKTLDDRIPKLLTSATSNLTNFKAATKSTFVSTSTITTPNKLILPATALVTTVAATAITLLSTYYLPINTNIFSYTTYTTTTTNMNDIAARIYDSVIVHMTEKWYQCVLSQLDDNSVVLDVGIGTAGALLRCQEIIKAKNLRIIGIDYNSYYVKSAQSSIEKCNMTKYISVHCIDLYDDERLQQVIQDCTNDNGNGNDGNSKGKVDVVYFSGSFSLLPDPKGALLMILPYLKKEEQSSSSSSSSSTGNHPTKRKSGLVYITQTYQKKAFFFMSQLKPLVKYITTIDFGQLVMVDEISMLLNDDELVDNGLILKTHEVIEGSLDNYWQAAYVSVLEVN